MEKNAARRASWQSVATGEVPVTAVEQIEEQPVVNSRLWRGVGWAVTFEAAFIGVVLLAVTFGWLLAQVVEAVSR